MPEAAPTRSLEAPYNPFPGDLLSDSEQSSTVFARAMEAVRNSELIRAIFEAEASHFEVKDQWPPYYDNDGNVCL